MSGKPKAEEEEEAGGAGGAGVGVGGGAETAKGKRKRAAAAAPAKKRGEPKKKRTRKKDEAAGDARGGAGGGAAEGDEEEAMAIAMRQDARVRMAAREASVGVAFLQHHPAAAAALCPPSAVAVEALRGEWEAEAHLVSSLTVDKEGDEQVVTVPVAELQEAAAGCATVARVLKARQGGKPCCSVGCLAHYSPGLLRSLHEQLGELSKREREAVVLMNILCCRKVPPQGSTPAAAKRAADRAGSGVLPLEQRKRISYFLPVFGTMCRTAFMTLVDMKQKRFRNLLKYLHTRESFVPRTHGLAFREQTARERDAKIARVMGVVRQMLDRLALAIGEPSFLATCHAPSASAPSPPPMPSPAGLPGPSVSSLSAAAAASAALVVAPGQQGRPPGLLVAGSSAGAGAGSGGAGAGGVVLASPDRAALAASTPRAASAARELLTLMSQPGAAAASAAALPGVVSPAAVAGARALFAGSRAASSSSSSSAGGAVFPVFLPPGFTDETLYALFRRLGSDAVAELERASRMPADGVGGGADDDNESACAADADEPSAGRRRKKGGGSSASAAAAAAASSSSSSSSSAAAEPLAATVSPELFSAAVGRLMTAPVPRRRVALRDPDPSVCDDCSLVQALVAGARTQSEIEGASRVLAAHLDDARPMQRQYDDECAAAERRGPSPVPPGEGGGSGSGGKGLSSSSTPSLSSPSPSSPARSVYTIGFCSDLHLPSLPSMPAFEEEMRRSGTLRDMHVFAVHSSGSRSNTVFVYDEGDGERGADEAVSLFHHFLFRHAATSRSAAFEVSSRDFVVYVAPGDGGGLAANTQAGLLLQYVAWLAACGHIDRAEVRFLPKGHARAHELAAASDEAAVVLAGGDFVSPTDFIDAVRRSRAASPPAAAAERVTLPAAWSDFMAWASTLAGYLSLPLQAVDAWHDYAVSADAPFELLSAPVRRRRSSGRRWRSTRLLRPGLDPKAVLAEGSHFRRIHRVSTLEPVGVSPVRLECIRMQLKDAVDADVLRVLTAPTMSVTAARNVSTVPRVSRDTTFGYPSQYRNPGAMQPPPPGAPPPLGAQDDAHAAQLPPTLHGLTDLQGGGGGGGFGTGTSPSGVPGQFTPPNLVAGFFSPDAAQTPPAACASPFLSSLLNDADGGGASASVSAAGAGMKREEGGA